MADQSTRPARSALRRGAITLVAALALAGCASSSSPSPSGPAQSDPAGTPSGELTTLRFSYDWSPDSDWAAIVWAQELGYFAEAGVEVEYLPGDPTLIEKFATQQFDMAQLPGPLAVQAYADDLPFTVVAVSQPGSPLVVIADGEKVTEPKDIEGTKVAVQVGEFEGSVWEAWAETNGIDRSQVEEVPAGGTADVLFIDHQVDVFMDFYSSGAMVELTEGREGEETLFPVADTLPIIGQSFAVHNDYLAANPEAVRGFLAGWARGAKYMIDHPDETVELVLETFPELEREGVEWSTARFIEFWSVDQTESDGLLSFTPDMWESTKAMLVEANLMEDVDVSGMYTTEYLPDPPVTP